MTCTPKLSPQLAEEASDWFVEFSEGTVDTSGREQFDAWLRRSPEHVQAYLKISAIWEDAPMLGHRRVLASDQLVARVLAEGNVVPLVPGLVAEKPVDNKLPDPAVTVSPSVPPQLDEKKKPLRVRFFAIAAALLLSVGAGTWLYVQRGTYSTAIGEQRSVRLEDGSTLDMNSQSKVRVRFSDHQRTVELLEGQALFRVAKDRARPFVVATDTTHVRAVGTQFDVYRKSSGTVVTVLEGRVAVLSEVAPPRVAAETRVQPVAPAKKSPPNDPKSIIPESTRPGSAAPSPEPPPATFEPQDGEVLVAAGEQLTVTPGSMSSSQAADVTLATAWTQRKIAFKGATLHEVVEEFNRYNTRPLVIADPTLMDTRISGVFSSTDPDSLLRFLRALPNISVQETSSEIRITRK